MALINFNCKFVLRTKRHDLHPTKVPLFLFLLILCTSQIALCKFKPPAPPLPVPDNNHVSMGLPLETSSGELTSQTTTRQSPTTSTIVPELDPSQKVGEHSPSKPQVEVNPIKISASTTKTMETIVDTTNNPTTTASTNDSSIAKALLKQSGNLSTVRPLPSEKVSTSTRGIGTPSEDDLELVTSFSTQVSTPCVGICPAHMQTSTSSHNSTGHDSTTSSSVSTASVHPLLIYSIRYEIRSLDLQVNTIDPKHPSSKTLIAGLKNTIGLDFYYSSQESFIFWTDVAEERIYRGTIANGTITNVDVVVQTGLATAEGLAVDWIGRNIYWVESTLNHIEVANLKGTSRRTLLAGDMESPRAIVLDPRYGLLFWTDWDKKSPRIERATMTGEERKTLVYVKEVNGGWPNGLTLDYDALTIYWIDANSDSIHVVDYEGNKHRTVLRQFKSLGHPFSITLFEDSLFWTDWKTNTISTANKTDGSEPKGLEKISSRLFDIKVFHPSRQPPGFAPSPCSPQQQNGGCSHLCLVGTLNTHKCMCPRLMKLAADQKTCVTEERVLLIGRANEIKAVDIAEPLHYVMAPIGVPKVFNPRQFEFDAKSKTIYWTDSQTNEVKRAQLSGTNGIDTIIDVIIESPSGLALDWISGNIYVTSSAQHKSPGKILISNLNGEFISTFMDHQQGIISPKSLAVHPLLGLLFCIDEDENSKPLLFAAGMHGGNKKIISTSGNSTIFNPSNLAMDFSLNRVYWINQAISRTENATIQYYDIEKNEIITLYNEVGLPTDRRLNASVLCVDGDHLIMSSRSSNDVIIRASKYNLTEYAVFKTQNQDQITALRVYNASSQVGTNACSQNNGDCSQLCVPMNSTHKTCKCTMGYSINPANETDCIGKDLFLIFSYNFGMKGIGLEPNSSPDDYYLPPIHRAFRASSIDYVHRDNLIYWVDNEEGSITRINRDTTNYKVIVQGLESEECIGVDWVAGNIYWIDPYYDIIEVARLDGSNRYVIVSGDMDKANGIVVNPIKGYIVWSDIGSLPKLETAKLDGSERSILVNTKLSHIDDLTVDYYEDIIYWVDSTTSTIERIKVDGTGRQVVFVSSDSSLGAHYHHFVSIAFHESHLYVADSIYNQGSIISFEVNRTSQYNVFNIVHKHLGDGIRDIAIFAEQPLPMAEENPCVLNNGGCQDLCLFTGIRGMKRCICSHGKLKPDGLTCKPYDTFILFSRLSQIDSLHIGEDESLSNSPYQPISLENKSTIISLAVDYDEQRVIYSDLARDQICSVMFNGTGRRVLVDKKGLVEGIAFASNQLYWTSIQDNSISRLNTTSTGIRRVICDGSSCRPSDVEKIIRLSPEDKPRGIAIDSCTSYIYWTNWNNNPSIQRASPHEGYKIESIITSNIRVPNGITIDQRRRKLYWCDARLDKIETCDMDGTNRIVLIAAGPQHPFAITIWKDDVYWTDWLARAVFKANKYTGQPVSRIKKVAQRPMGIAVAGLDKVECLINSCGANNGDCPPGTTCVPRHHVNGEIINECHLLGIGHDLLLPPPKCTHLDDQNSCNRTDQDIIMDQLDRYRDLLIPNSDSAIAPTAQEKASNHNLDFRTLETSSTKSITTPKTLSGTTDAVTTPTSSIVVSLATRSSPLPTSAPIVNSSLPPCQISPAALQPITDSSSNNDCKVDDQFKCYLSEKLVCIPNEKRCDGNADCPSKEDENDCYLSGKGQYNLKHDANWYKFVTVILVILGAALAALFLVFGNRGRRRWFYSTNGAFGHRKMFEDNGTNIEISNPMFDEDDSANLVHCAFSIDLSERTTNFSNPLYERQVLLMNDKNVTPNQQGG